VKRKKPPQVFPRKTGVAFLCPAYNRSKYGVQKFQIPRQKWLFRSRFDPSKNPFELVRLIGPKSNQPAARLVFFWHREKSPKTGLFWRK
jgi:hypothetical protein